MLYREKGEYEKAEPLLLEWKEVLRKAVGEEHPSYATSLNNLGDLYKNDIAQLILCVMGNPYGGFFAVDADPFVIFSVF